MADWPHQIFGIETAKALIGAKARRICVTCPTGGGKTKMMLALAELYSNGGVVIYTNRRLLLEQSVRVLETAGFEHGVRAAGHADDRHLPLQISSLPTEHSRVVRRGSWNLHDADLVLVDEAHAQKGPTARRILDEHVERGAAVVGFTATPVGLGGLYDELVVAGTPSELRTCGALVAARHYGPDEPDLSKIGRFRLGGDLTEKQNVKAMMVPGIFGRVLDWYRRLNPAMLPSILFAPGVGESVFFAEEFIKAGVAAAHIDGQDVFVRGKWYRSSPEARKDVLCASEAREVRVLCNRYVLREGIDAPWLGHGILATVFGSLQSYLQAGGRLLRAHPGLSHVTLQDHGGNWWRHGSVNADRSWRLGDTNQSLAALRYDRYRNPRTGDEPQPARCPRCAAILLGGTCPCGFVLASRPRSRPVIQADGTAREYQGEVFRPRETAATPKTPEMWKRMYYRARNGGMTFLQAEALFAQENDWRWPPRTLPLMPSEPDDWIRRVADVPTERLNR